MALNKVWRQHKRGRLRRIVCQGKRPEIGNGHALETSEAGARARMSWGGRADTEGESLYGGLGQPPTNPLLGDLRGEKLRRVPPDVADVWEWGGAGRTPAVSYCRARAAWKLVAAATPQRRRNAGVWGVWADPPASCRCACGRAESAGACHAAAQPLGRAATAQHSAPPLLDTQLLGAGAVGKGAVAAAGACCCAPSGACCAQTTTPTCASDCSAPSAARGRGAGGQEGQPPTRVRGCQSHALIVPSPGAHQSRRARGWTRSARSAPACQSPPAQPARR